MDDVHHLEHDARPLLVRAVARGDEEQVARRQVGGDLVGDRHRERAREVIDRVGADVLEAAHLFVRLGVELVEPQEAIDLAVIGEAEVVPVAMTESPRSIMRTAVTSASVELTGGGRPRDTRQDGGSHPPILRPLAALRQPQGRCEQTDHAEACDHDSDDGEHEAFTSL